MAQPLYALSLHAVAESSSMKRRSFLPASLATVPLAACAPAASNSGSLVQRRSTGVLVRRGQDRFESPLTVFGGLRLDVKVSPGDPVGGLYIVEHTDEATGGPPQHIHHDQDEWFCVLVGAYVRIVGDGRFDLEAGDSVFAPRGVPHVWAHTDARTGWLLLAFQPAGHVESLVTGLAQSSSAPPPQVLGPLFSCPGMATGGPPLLV